VRQAQDRREGVDAEVASQEEHEGRLEAKEFVSALASAGGS
jgi:hypothetical protein